MKGARGRGTGPDKRNLRPGFDPIHGICSRDGLRPGGIGSREETMVVRFRGTADKEKKGKVGVRAGELG